MTTQQSRTELTAAQEAEVDALVQRFAALRDVADLFPPPRPRVIGKALLDGGRNLEGRECCS